VDNGDVTGMLLPDMKTFSITYTIQICYFDFTQFLREIDTHWPKKRNILMGL